MYPLVSCNFHEHEGRRTEAAEQGYQAVKMTKCDGALYRCLFASLSIKQQRAYEEDGKMAKQDDGCVMAR